MPPIASAVSYYCSLVQKTALGNSETKSQDTWIAYISIPKSLHLQWLILIIPTDNSIFPLHKVRKKKG